MRVAVLLIGLLWAMAAVHVVPAVQAQDRSPVRQAPIDAVALLARTPGSFAYDFGGAGWPNGWSPFGLDPGRVSLSLNGIPFNDLATGAPRYDLLPMGWIDSLQVAPSRGRAVSVSTRLRSFEADRPLTELRYGSSTAGLQSVSVAHVQTRAAFGGRSRLLFGYAGAGATGEYPGSALRRKRQILMRLQVERPGWSVEFGELFNRHRVGAHGGVQQVGGFTYESIYQRLGATVDQSSAQRETIRNDLWVTGRRAFLGEPLAVTAFWTTQTLQYRLPSDSTTARIHRWGLRAVQPLGGGLTVEAHHWTDRFRSGDAFERTPDNRSESRIGAAFGRSMGRFELQASAGVGAIAGAASSDASAELSTRLGAIRLFVAGSTGRPEPALVDRFGFGETYRARMVSEEHIQLLRGGAALSTGPFLFEGSGFLVGGALPHERFEGQDSTTVFADAGSQSRVGALLAVRFREGSSRGIYASTWVVLSTGNDLAPEVERAVPGLFGYLRTGARMNLFQGDLDLDLYLQARGWNTAGSRVLHPQTGLLLIPDAGSRPIEGSVILDVVAEAGVRGATLFFSFENVLSGTQLIVGNQLVVGYPYPERRFRFGVFWPIFD